MADVTDYLKKKYGIADQYKQAAEDTTALKEAQSRAQGTNDAADWAGLIDSTIGNGKAKGTLDNMRGEAATGVANAQAAHKAKLDTLLMGDKLAREDVTRSQDDQKFADSRTKFGWETEGHEHGLARRPIEEGQTDALAGVNLTKGKLGNAKTSQDLANDKRDNDPNSNAAIATRNYLSQKLGVDSATLEGLTHSEMLKLPGTQPKGGRTTLVAVDKPGGGNELVWVNPDTQEITKSGYAKAWAPTVDAATGSLITKAPNVPAQTIMADSGGTLADKRTGLGAQRAGANKVATEGVVADVAAAKAEAGAEDTKDIAGEWTALHKIAEQEGNTGPWAGRWSQFVSDKGYSNGSATDKLISSMQRKGNAYIHEMTGAAGSDPEYQRLLRTMPSIAQEGPLFQTRLADWIDDVQRTGAKLKATASKIKGGAPQAAAATTASSNKGAPTRKQFKRDAAGNVVKTRLTYADGTTEDVDGQQ